MSLQVPVLRRMFAQRKFCWIVVASTIVGWLVFAGALQAPAQSPWPNASMEDRRPSGPAYDPGVGAFIVEGLGSLNCSYSLSSVESQTASFINAGIRTITEFSPQSICDTRDNGGAIINYEAVLNGLAAYLKQNAPGWTTWWGGIMWDEETGYGYTATDIENLNSYSLGLMKPGGYMAGGIAWVYTEDAPGQWTQAVYNAIIAGTIPAPQIYNQTDSTIANNSIATENLVTVCETCNQNTPWEDPNSASGPIAKTTGAPYSGFGVFGGWYWWNLWQAQ